jgi:YHS domain-containing protein
MKLICYYCSKEIDRQYIKNENEEETKLKGSIWFCSHYCKDTFVNNQINRKRIQKEER